ncbi:MAG: hypothetical protein JWM75_416 [Sphingomonas bacterium]|nr:hypothetical protein [Sphingomonas bacterium]
MNSLILAFLLAAAPVDYGPALNAAVFDRAWSLVDDHYWDRDAHAADWAEARKLYRPRALAAPNRQALYAVLSEMLATLGDSHVYADDPAGIGFDEAREAGGQGGFGFASWQSDGAWRIFAVQPDSPAARAGVQVGWELTALNGRPLDMDYHPDPGDSADVAFRDELGQTHRMRLTATALPPEPERNASRIGGGILLLRLNTFDHRPDRWIAGEIAHAAPRGVILDLRENYGGEAMSVGRVAGRLFTRKTILLRRIGRKGPVDVPMLGAGSRSYRGPLVVLVGPRTASGAEALAAAVEESGRGTTVGERTAGALTGAARYPLPDGGEISVAEFDIRTAKDQRLEGRGFTPREVVTPSFAASRRGEDPALARAIALLEAGR